MNYGNLTVICGPMFSGKTTETLKRILWAKNGEGKEVFVFKPTFDTRYGNSEIVNHDGLKSNAISISELPNYEMPSGSLVFLDEVQFYIDPFFKGDIVAWVKTLLENGVEVIAAGLDMDWKGNPFDVTAKLLAMSTEFKKLKAICTICGRPASKTFKKDQYSVEAVELGATDLYEARCNQHWA
jgi:thymidine kinase